MNDEIPLSIGGGIGQSRVYMWLLRKARLGEGQCRRFAGDSQRDQRQSQHLVLEQTTILREPLIQDSRSITNGCPFILRTQKNPLINHSIN